MTECIRYIAGRGIEEVYSDDIDFWSAHFSEYVYRLMTEGVISYENAQRFFMREKKFMTLDLSNPDTHTNSNENHTSLH